MAHLLRPLVGFGAVLLIWQAIVVAGVLPQEYFPGIPAIVAALRDLLVEPAFWRQEGLSLGRLVPGLVFAVISGMAVAMVGARYAVVRKALTPFVQIFVSLPPAALVPLAIFTLGLEWRLFVFIIWFSGVWAVYLAAANALSSGEPVQLHAARSFGYGVWERLCQVQLPAAAPEAFTGIRLAATACMMATVASEMLAGSNGLGFILYDAAFALQTPRTFALLFIVGIHGLLLNRAVLALRGVFAGWQDQLTRMAEG
jgi:ABC-type nitrate/sulfonate/bicarbonate transport system permease component